MEEEGVHYEGDMIFPDGSSKVAISNPAARWPNGVVPYVIEGIWPFGFSKQNIGDIVYFFYNFFYFLQAQARQMLLTRLLQISTPELVDVSDGSKGQLSLTMWPSQVPALAVLLM